VTNLSKEKTELIKRVEKKTESWIIFLQAFDLNVTNHGGFGDLVVNHASLNFFSFIYFCSNV